ncbi:MAG TPA: pyridoxal phosphate-dependent aminotransferase, partial [Planctomycetota bacterium]|nr:pyridoxal phosphate-dependent aminotransferase [Planctomycetota bacterium]
MNFQPIRYLEWAKRNHEVAPPELNLAASAVEPPPVEMLGGLDGLAIRGNNAYGHPRLREAIAKRYDVSPATVLCSVPGASMAYFLLAAALVRAGDAVLVEWPCYEPLWRNFEALGARIEWLERRPEARYAIDLGRVETAFVRGARVLALSNLMNPTGVLAPAATVRAAGAIAARHGGTVLVDEIYLDGVFDGRPEARTAAGAEGIAVLSSLTKIYGLGGLRAGWAIAPQPLVARGFEVLSHLAIEQAYIADEVAARAFDRLPELRARAERIQRENLPLVRDFAAGRRDVELVEPDGGFVAWLRLTG